MAHVIESPAVAPEIVELEGRQAAVVRLSGSPSSLPALMREAFELTMGQIAASGAQVAGPPFSRYHGFGDPIDAEAGFPYIGTLAETERVYAIRLPAGRAVLATHVGSYEGIGEAWSRVDAWIHEHGLVQTSAPWEAYLTGPDDPGQPVTQIVFPVR